MEELTGSAGWPECFLVGAVGEWSLSMFSAFYCTNMSVVCLVTKSCPTFFQTPWTVAHQAPLSIQFPRQEYWSRLLFPSSGNLPHPGIKSTFAALGGRFFTTKLPGKPTVDLIEQQIPQLILKYILGTGPQCVYVCVCVCVSVCVCV